MLFAAGRPIGVVEAKKAGVAPQVILEATHASVVEFVDLEVLREHAWKGSGEVDQ